VCLASIRIALGQTFIKVMIGFVQRLHPCCTAMEPLNSTRDVLETMQLGTVALGLSEPAAVCRVSVNHKMQNHSYRSVDDAEASSQ
jgi:hypothetical protein